MYHRFIDDVLCIWLVDPDPAKDHRKWTVFKSLMQDYYGLEWMFEEFSDTVDCMDMKISIHEDRIVTSLYEKAINLYLYTPPHSAYLPGVLTRLVAGNILRIHLLCSDKEDINRCMKEIYVRLLVHGYQRDWLIPVFAKGIRGARAFIKLGSV